MVGMIIEQDYCEFVARKLAPLRNVASSRAESMRLPTFHFLSFLSSSHSYQSTSKRKIMSFIARKNTVCWMVSSKGSSFWGGGRGGERRKRKTFVCFDSLIQVLSSPPQQPPLPSSSISQSWLFRVRIINMVEIILWLTLEKLWVAVRRTLCEGKQRQRKTAHRSRLILWSRSSL